MGILTHAEGGGLLHAEAEDLHRKLIEGDGIVWGGDPRLELGMGKQVATRRMRHPVTGKMLNKGDVVFYRYEVYRYMEDGSIKKLGTWRLEEFDMILPDIVKMRAGFEGKMPDAEHRIDAHNDEMDRANTQEIADWRAQVRDHADYVFGDKRTIGMYGKLA